MSAREPSEVMQDLAAAATTKKRLRKSDFSLSNGTGGEESTIATYDVETPLVLREQADIRLVLTTVEEFQTAGNGNQETFSLSNDIISQVNSADLVLYSDGSRTSPDSIDYANDSFDYTDGGNQERLHAHYVARDPGQVEIEKVAPRSQGRVSEVVYDDATSLLHERDQNDEPPSFDFDQPEAKAVPRKWQLRITLDAPYPAEWDDSSENNSQDTTATNAIVSLPTKVASRDVPGLGGAVKRHIIR